MFAQPTLNDFLDNLRWHLAKATTRARQSLDRMRVEHAKHGTIHSSMTCRRTFEIVREEFEAGVEVALGELKRAIRTTGLDRNDLRQLAIQTLETFAGQAKALMANDMCRNLMPAAVDENLRSLDQHLLFMIRQFDTGFFDPKEPEVPRVHNAINIGSMSGSNIQQGTANSHQNAQYNLHFDQIRAAVTAFESATRAAEWPPNLLNELVADIETIEAQLSKPSPSPTILQEAGRSLRSIVEGVAAGILTPPVIAAAPALWSALGLG